MYFSTAVPMIQQLETTLRSGAAPQVPQFRPRATSQSSTPNLPIKVTSTKAPADKVNSEAPKINEIKTASQTVPPAVKPAGIQDPLGNARTKVQEEINSEFATIMATGTLRASEAAALATKRVMQRHGHLNATLPQS